AALLVTPPAPAAKGGQDEPIPILPMCMTLTFDDGTPDIHIGTPAEPPLFASADINPLEPRCNECLIGTFCIVQDTNGGTSHVDCCGGTAGNCTKCSICKIRPVGGDHTVSPSLP